MVYQHRFGNGTYDIAFFNIVAYLDAGFELPFFGTAESRNLDSSGDIRSYCSNHFLQRSLDAVIHGLNEAGAQFY